MSILEKVTNTIGRKAQVARFAAVQSVPGLFLPDDPAMYRLRETPEVAPKALNDDPVWIPAPIVDEGTQGHTASVEVSSVTGPSVVVDTTNLALGTKIDGVWYDITDVVCTISPRDDYLNVDLDFKVSPFVDDQLIDIDVTIKGYEG